MGMGLESYIAQLSMNMSAAATANQVSVGVLKMQMDASEQTSMQLIDQMQNMPPPAATGDLGGLLDVRA
ncbi:MAG: YjfB family protein [Eubacterium sp.]|nr:YjfB family protein [Eubacterium sp.]